MDNDAAMSRVYVGMLGEMRRERYRGGERGALLICGSVREAELRWVAGGGRAAVLRGRR